MEEILEKLGLTRGEIKIYLALNKLGETTIGPIGSVSKVSKSKMYDILDKLIDKGLAGYIIKNGARYYTANDPQMLLGYIKKQEEDLGSTKEAITKILPQLLLQRASASQKKVAEIYEGLHGIKAIREELIQTLKSGEKLLVLGAPKVANQKWEGWFLDFHKRRIKRNVSMNIIYNANAREFGAIRKKMKLTNVKYLPNNLISPNWIDIFNDAILLVMILDTPIAFVVRNKELAQSFKSYFEIMWKISEE
ncbi:hypothetical protein HZA96_07100 [Candidatus Woesearchaeota archaeon]|nr:hypothetical protein [Candidatus Woesearchaeota archaeon]